MEEKEEGVKNLLKALSWAKSVSLNDRLWITPTVKANLMLAPSMFYACDTESVFF